MSQSYTPPSAGFVTTPFSDAEKVDVRRYCGYETYGGEGSAGFQGWRYYQEYGLLEFRMNNLAPAEYANVRFRLSLLTPIEAALAAMYATINVAGAGPFTRNALEYEDRQRHYSGMRRELCAAVGITPGPLLPGARGGRIQA